MNWPPATESARAAWLLLVTAIVAAYANSFSGGFQFDDWNVIAGDPRVQSLDAWWRSMPGIRPLLKLSYALNHELGAGLAGFHAFNLLVHVANALLVFCLVARVAERFGASRDRAVAAALLTATLFALHPVQTEAVTYLSGRSVSLSAFFALIALLLWLRESLPTRLAAVACWFCALAVKETMLVWPLAPAAAAVVMAHEARHKLALASLGLWGAMSVAIVALVFSPSYQYLLTVSLEARGMGENLLLQAQAVTYLLGQWWMPWELNADPSVSQIRLPPWTTGLVLAGLAAVFSAGLYGTWHGRAWGFGLFWFFLWLAPTNSLLPRLDPVNERQLYLAMLGPTALLSAWLARRLEARRLLLLTLGLAAILGGATWSRNRVYYDEAVFWQDVIAKSPDNARAYNNLGYAYARQGQVGLAESAFRQALIWRPDYVQAAVNLRLLREGALRPSPDADATSTKE